MLGKRYPDSVLMAGISKLSGEGGVAKHMEVRDHTLKISEDANILSGKGKFTLKSAISGNCDGITIYAYKRKP